MPAAAFRLPAAAALAALLALAPVSSSQAQTGQPSAQDLEAIAQQFGGAYQDAALSKYVASIGQLLVATTPMANQKFTFTVLNSAIVNAFSVPGGHVFVTRGLIALANDEAELAGVLGHEIGHITAGHAQQREQRSTWAQLGAAGAGILGALFGSPTIGSIASEVVGVGATAWVQKYSREQEYQADELGVRYMSAAGYDPEAMASFLKSLEAQTEVENQLAGRPPGDQGFDMMADHPRTLDRVQRATAEARAARPATALDRGIYLKKIDGILYGDDPKDGVVRGRVFYHPGLRFAFDVPPHFQVLNGAAQVHAEGPNGAAFLFDRAPKPFQGSPEQYIAQVWAPNAAQKIQASSINGMSAATALAQAQANGAAVTVRLVAIRFDPSTLYRFVFILPESATLELAAAYTRTADSFRRLSPEEAARIKLYRVKVVTVTAGQTAESLSAQLPFEQLKLDQFLMLNGLTKGAALKPGDQVKLVVAN